MEDPLAQSLLREHVPIQYFNGFAIGVGNADFSLSIRLENRDVMVLKCSYTVAKTLAQKVSEVVGKFEKVTDHNLMTTEQVGESLRATEEKKAAEQKNVPRPAAK